jgi:hypothetical protein
MAASTMNKAQCIAALAFSCEGRAAPIRSEHSSRLCADHVLTYINSGANFESSAGSVEQEQRR